MQYPTSPVQAMFMVVLLLAVVVQLAIYSFSISPIPPEHKPTTVKIPDTTLATMLTGCGLCRESGACDTAFKGIPGQFCLTLPSGEPCCCPQDAACVLSTTKGCRCRRASSVTVATTTTTKKIKKPIKEDLWEFLVMMCLVWTAFGCFFLVEYTIQGYRWYRYGEPFWKPPSRQRSAIRRTDYDDDDHRAYTASDDDGDITTTVATTTTFGGEYFSGDGGDSGDYGDYGDDDGDDFSGDS